MAQGKGQNKRVGIDVTAVGSHRDNRDQWSRRAGCTDQAEDNTDKKAAEKTVLYKMLHHGRFIDRTQSAPGIKPYQETHHSRDDVGPHRCDREKPAELSDDIA